MTQATFYIAIVLAVILAGLTLTETWVYRKWDQAAAEQKDVQAKLVYAQRLNVFTEQFLRRLAIDSQHDPALAEMLKKHKVKVIVSTSGQSADATRTEGMPEEVAVPGPADKTLPVPTIPTPAQP